MAVRHTCAVCQSRKVIEDFPLSISGRRATATCSECLGQTLGTAAAWYDLGLQQPGREGDQNPTAYDNQDVSQQPEDGTTTDKPTLKRKRRNTTGWPSTKRRKQAKTPATPPAPQSATCRICVEEKDITEFIKNARNRKTSTAIPFDCVAHLSYKRSGNRVGGPVCKSCVGNSLTAGLDTVGAENLGCLEPGCLTGPWDYHYISLYMLPDALENYHEQMFTTFMARATTFKCLNSECETVGLLERTAPGFPNVVCTACNHRHCALCEVDWHEGMSCQAYRAKNHKELVSKEEKATLRMLSKMGAKRCPRCQLAIEKDGGCNSMYCSHCRRYFDWYVAEPVIGVSSKAAPVREQPEYWREVCEADALAAPPVPPPTVG